MDALSWGAYDLRHTGAYRWVWPLSEIVHFVGLTLLVGIVGFFDLRLIGVARRLPVAPLRQLLSWAVFGFVLCVHRTASGRAAERPILLITEFSDN